MDKYSNYRYILENLFNRFQFLIIFNIYNIFYYSILFYKYKKKNYKYVIILFLNIIHNLNFFLME